MYATPDQKQTPSEALHCVCISESFGSMAGSSRAVAGGVARRTGSNHSQRLTPRSHGNGK